MGPYFSNICRTSFSVSFLLSIPTNSLRSAKKPEKQINLKQSNKQETTINTLQILHFYFIIFSLLYNIQFMHIVRLQFSKLYGFLCFVMLCCW